MRKKAKMYGIVLCALSFIVCLSMVFLPSQRQAKADSTENAFGVNYTLKTSMYADYSGVTKANLTVTTDETKNGSNQSLYGLHMRSDKTYDDAYLANDDYIPYSQSACISVDSVVDTSKTLEFFVNPSLTGHSGQHQNAHFVIALSDDLNANIVGKTGFTGTNAVKLDFSTQSVSGDVRKSGSIPLLNGVALPDNDFNTVIYSTNTARLLKVTMRFFNEGGEDKVGVILGHWQWTPDLKSLKDYAERVYSLTENNLSLTSTMKIYMGYYSTGADEGKYIAQGHDEYKDGQSAYLARRQTCALDIYNYKNGNVSSVTAKEDSLLFDCLSDESTYDVFDNIKATVFNGVKEAPELSLTSNNPDFVLDGTVLSLVEGRTTVTVTSGRQI
ncbi:MAG: hypothetical protein MJ072_04045, partial [Clostridia bacterium]|nr:hypothetical protein [Clostridia bacterium]